MFDSETLTQILALLTGAWTLFQEIRHRKQNPKAPKPPKDLFKPKAVK